jgi:hypothetical protein
MTYSILKCPKCGNPAIYEPKAATKCRGCNHKLNPSHCFAYKEGIATAKEAAYMRMRVTELIEARRLGG